MQRLRLTVDEMSAGRWLTAAACRWDRRELGPLKVPLPEEKAAATSCLIAFSLTARMQEDVVRGNSQRSQSIEAGPDFYRNLYIFLATGELLQRIVGN